MTSETPSRRVFLADFGLGFAGLALGSLLRREAAADGGGESPKVAHFPPRARSVIWIFNSGGYSHLETFDPKPALNRYAGKTFDETPFPNPTRSSLHAQRSRSVLSPELEKQKPPQGRILPLQVGFRKHGQSGIEISDWWPHLAECVDEIAFVRSMYTTDNDHAAENQIHTGRHRLDELQPGLGAWVSYGLGALNQNLPQYVVLSGAFNSSTRPSISANYLGPRHGGVPLALDPRDPLPYGTRDRDVPAEAQRNEYELIGELNRLRGVNYPDDPGVLARIRRYELAFGMQAAVPEAVALGSESEETRRLYGLDRPETREAGERFLAARRLVERGVRFVQVYPIRPGAWDAHENLRSNHSKRCLAADKPVAGLLHDLRRRGLSEDVVVVFCTEFGRTPGLDGREEKKAGRGHHPHGFTVWLWGAGLKRGVVHGATDELGYHGEPVHYVTDLHATVLHLLGLDSHRLDFPGRRRLRIDHGDVIRPILA